MLDDGVDSVLLLLLPLFGAVAAAAAPAAPWLSTLRCSTGVGGMPDEEVEFVSDGTEFATRSPSAPPGVLPERDACATS